MIALSELLFKKSGGAAAPAIAPAFVHQIEIDTSMTLAFLIAPPTSIVMPADVAQDVQSSSARINTTARTLRFIVPLTDGPAYLGDVELAVTSKDELSVAAPRLLQMLQPIIKRDVLDRIQMLIGKSTVITEEQLKSEGFSLVYDSQNLKLAINVPVSVRETRNISLRDAAVAGTSTLQPATMSGYLNTRFAMDVVEHGPDRGFVPPVAIVDAAFRVSGVVAEAEGYFSLRRNEPTLRRSGSRLVYDDIARTVRWTLGDIRSYGRSFQSTPTLAGITVSRSYSILDPQRQVRPSGRQGFTIFAPSTVSTIVNGQIVERKLVQPGNYSLQDFPLADGGNNVRLEIEDPTGQETVIDFDLYSNQQLLEPGATEFSGFAGIYAEPTQSGIAYSGRWNSSGYVRRGITQQLTAGFNYVGDSKAQQVGFELLSGSKLGLVGFDIAASRRSKGPAGFAGTLRYEKVIGSGTDRSHSVRALIELRSSAFAVPGALVRREPISQRVSAGYAMTFGRDSYIAFDGQYSRDRIDRVTLYGLRASGGFRLSPQFSIVGEAEFNQNRIGQKNSLFRIGLRHRFGARAQVQLDADTRGVFRSGYQNSGGQGVGAWSTSVDVNRNKNDATLNASGNLVTNRFDLGINQIASFNQNASRFSNIRTSLRAGTSIAFADGAVAMGRPIQDGFLIAKPHESLGGKSVRLNPQQKSDEAHSDSLGPGLIGSLSAYSPRLIVYEVPDAPLGYDLGQGNIQIAPPYRGGYKLEIGSDYNLLVIGRLLSARGEPVSLLAGKAIDLQALDRPALTVFTSRDGKFGAQGLRPGRWRVEMPTEPPTIYEFNVLENAGGIVRLGDIQPVRNGRDLP